MHIFGHLRGEISTPLRLPLNLITHDSHQLTRTLTSWDTLSLWRERLRDCLGSASPSVPPREMNRCILQTHSWSSNHPSILMTSHERPWQIMFSIIQHCCSLLGAGPFAESTAGAATILLAHWVVETRHMHVTIHVYIKRIIHIFFTYVYIFDLPPPTPSNSQHQELLYL